MPVIRVAVLASGGNAPHRGDMSRPRGIGIVAALVAAGALTSACGGSSGATADPKAAAFCDAYKTAQQAVDTDFNQHPDLFQKAADIAPADIKAAADQVVKERQAAAGQDSTTQGQLDGLTESGIAVQTYCMPYLKTGN